MLKIYVMSTKDTYEIGYVDQKYSKIRLRMQNTFQEYVMLTQLIQQ